MHVTEPRHYATDALLRDGGSIHIRAIRPDDKQRLVALFASLSSRSIYFRFFQTKQRLTDEELHYFTELDFRRDAALVGEHLLHSQCVDKDGDRLLRHFNRQGVVAFNNRWAGLLDSAFDNRGGVDETAIETDLAASDAGDVE